MFKNWNNKFKTGFALALVLAMAFTAVALADIVTSDVDFVDTGNQTFKNLGDVSPGQIVSTSTSFQLVCAGKNHADDGDTVTVYKHDAIIPAGGSLTAGNATIGPIGTSWPDDTTGGGSTNCSATPEVMNDNGNSSVSITAPSTPGTYNYEVTYKVATSGGVDSNDVTGSIPAVTFTLTVVGDTTPPNTNITANPANPTNSTSASFSFTGTDDVTPPGSLTFECKLDAGSFGACTSPKIYSGLSNGSHTFEVRAKDAANNVDPSPASFTWTVDTVAPSVSCGSADSIWHATDQSVTCTATDGGSGPASQTVTLNTSVAAGDETDSAYTNSLPVCDAAGNCSTAGPVGPFKIDKKNPSYSCDAAPSSWSATDVSIACTASDGGSGLATPASFNLSTSVGAGTETVNASTGTAAVTDNVGNSVTAGPISGIKVDKKAPSITCGSADGLWHASDVSIACTASDGGSDLANPADASFNLSTSVLAGTEDANASTGTHSVADAVGNSATAGPIAGNKVDKKAPQQASCESPDGLWHANNVTLKCTYTDGGSGPASQDVSLTTSVAAGNETNNAFASAGGAQACDAVGNCAASPADIGGNKVDKKAPTGITFVGSSISDGGIYYFGFVPPEPTCTATDGGSGLASCVVMGYSSAIGTHTLTATATDNVGNSDTKTLSYEVKSWTLLGFYRPVDMPIPTLVYNTVKNGSTVPLKFEIFAGPTELTDVAYVKSLTYAQTSCDATATTDEIETTATGGTSLRYDATGGQFIYNWKTPSTAGKCYRVTMTTQDLSTLVAYFKLK